MRSQVAVLERPVEILRKTISRGDLTLEELLAEVGLLGEVCNGACLVVVNDKVVSAKQLHTITVSEEDHVVVVPVLYGG